jgi:hypothetical protein
MAQTRCQWLSADGQMSASFLSYDPACDMSYDMMAGMRHLSWHGTKKTSC